MLELLQRERRPTSVPPMHLEAVQAFRRYRGAVCQHSSRISARRFPEKLFLQRVQRGRHENLFQAVLNSVLGITVIPRAGSSCEC
jgi:hypothetical protein